MILDAARDLLVTEGISIGLGNITFKRVFDHLEATSGVRVTHSSVIERIWRDQDEFHLAVIDSVLNLTVPDDPLFERSIRRMIAVAETADRTIPEGRWEAMFEIARVGAADNLKLLQRYVWWPLWLNVWTWLATGEDGEGASDLRRAVRSNYRASDAIYEALYGGLMDYLGFRVKDGFTLHDMDTMFAWSAEGAAIRQRVDPDALKARRFRGKMWTPLGLAFRGIVIQALELIPDWEPSEA